MGPLGGKALHDPHACNGLFDHGRQLRRLLLHSHHRRVQAGREALGEHVHERQRPEGEHRQHRVDPHEDHEHRKDGGQVGDGEGHEHDGVLDLLQVGVGPAHELTGLLAIVVGEVEALEVGEEPVAQHGFGVTGLPEGRVAPQAGEAGRDQGGERYQQRVVGDGGLVAGFDALVDGLLDELGNADLGCGPDQARRHARQQAPPLGPHLARDQSPAVSLGALLGRVVRCGGHALVQRSSAIVPCIIAGSWALVRF